MVLFLLLLLFSNGFQTTKQKTQLLLKIFRWHVSQLRTNCFAFRRSRKKKILQIVFDWVLLRNKYDFNVTWSDRSDPSFSVDMLLWSIVCFFKTIQKTKEKSIITDFFFMIGIIKSNSSIWFFCHKKKEETTSTCNRWNKTLSVQQTTESIRTDNDEHIQ